MKISLNGEWQLRWYDGQRGDRLNRALSNDACLMPAIVARVPGSVHLDLLRAGLIQEPTIGLNHLAARWVEEEIWYYHRRFAAPTLAPGEHAWLTFACLDLSATIYVNGREIGRHANAFYPCRVEVTDALVAGENALLVVVEAGLYHAADRPGRGFGMHLDSELTKRQWLRKTQSSFGWDWATRLLNVGIRGEVWLETTTDLRVEGMVVLADLNAGLDEGTVIGRAIVENLTAAELPGVMRLTVEGTPYEASVPVKIAPGLARLEARLKVPSPELWWPVGHGRQTLYSVRVSLEVNGRSVCEEVRRTGFRHVRINQDPHPEGGSYFILEVNRHPVFVKGGNFVPADMLLARLDRDRYATLVDRALEANFNMLRVWGGGLYEADDFYALCDERGLLVWQEFIFACAKYPAFDEAFTTDVKQEATYQVRRLAHHPSLVVWCGNNEMEEGNFHWGYEKDVAHPDYALFHLVLPRIVKAEDGTRYYQPSSPFSPDHEDPRRSDVGDQHPWTVGFAETDFRKYREMAPRFPNEGGILGPTALPTVRACLPPGQEHIRSFAWEQHDNSVYAWGNTSYPDDMLVQWLGRSITSMSLEDYVYWAGVVQGEGLTEYIRNFRRRMFDTSSAIFWMYNDCWPAVRSWTIVDYYLRRTPAFHPVRRSFRPLSVALAVEDDRVRVYGINEGAAWQGEVRCGLFALAGGYPLEITCHVSLAPNRATAVAEFSLAEWTRAGLTTHGAFALLYAGGHEVARDRLFMPYFKEMAWPAVDVKVHRAAGQAVFESDVFAWRVCLDLSGEASLVDNFFDILPGIPTVLPWPEALGEPCILRTGNTLVNSDGSGARR